MVLFFAFIRRALGGFQMFLRQGNIVGSFNEKVLPVLAMLFGRISGRIVLVSLHLVAFG